MIIDIVEYIKPNDWPIFRKLEISDKCKEKYQEILDCNARLTCKQFWTMEVSQTIEIVDFNYDLILTQGLDLEENKEALEKMILRFDYVTCMHQKLVHRNKN